MSKGYESSDGSNEHLEEEEELKRDGLTKTHIAAYSVGHFCNDMTGAMWFFYFTLYLKTVVELPDEVIAIAFQFGQLCDGLSTPIMGILSDKFTTRWGSRTPWYVGGTVLVCVGFINLFS